MCLTNAEREKIVSSVTLQSGGTLITIRMLQRKRLTGRQWRNEGKYSSCSSYFSCSFFSCVSICLFLSLKHFFSILPSAPSLSHSLTHLPFPFPLPPSSLPTFPSLLPSPHPTHPFKYLAARAQVAPAVGSLIVPSTGDATPRWLSPPVSRNRKHWPGVRDNAVEGLGRGRQKSEEE